MPRLSPGRTSAPNGGRRPSTTCSPTSSRRCRRPIQGALGERGTLGGDRLYLLQINGAPAGPQPLTATRRNSLSTRRARAEQASAPAAAAAAADRAGSAAPTLPSGAGTGGGRGRGGASTNRGVTVRGEVKNYVPVTPEMLKNPPPGDWLIFRRNYYGQSYSPLNQITPANVKNLQLQWVWAMNDSGANQTTPIVHNGIIYLASPSNIVQALDGKDGQSDLGDARRARIRRRATAASAASRLPTTRSSCRRATPTWWRSSARNGEILWDTPAAPRRAASTPAAPS